MGLQEDGEKPKSAHPADRAGWLKKSAGGLLGLWKERYILLCKTQLLVYENEDDQKCVETVELGSYEACQDLRSVLMKKNRFILLRSPGNKVQNIKFQAKSPEEKEGWIKALNEGISKGKNRVFDEVTVDKSLALEHVTRDRVKVGQGRRPPTRIHLKEVANTASDGIMRLDLDLVDTGAVNFAPVANEIADVLPKEAPKPPMPPVKPNDSPALESSHLGNGSISEVHPQAPAPPSKALKENAWKDKFGSKEDVEKVDEECAGSSNRSSKEDLTEANTKNSDGTPAPPPKILSDKLKVKWEETSSEPELMEELKAGDGTPVPPPKILSDKLKVKWEESSSEPELIKEPKASVISTGDTPAKDATKPPAPPPKILSERLKIQADGVHSSQSYLEVTDQVSSAQVAATEDETADHSKESTSLKDQLQTKEDNRKEADREKEIELASEEQQVLSSGNKDDKEKTSKSCKQTGKFSASNVIHSDFPKPRRSSIGDLLSESSNTKEGKQGQLLDLRKHHLHRVEIKLASGQEKTELLLQKVLDGGLVQNQEGKGSEGNAGLLLREAVQELRQATDALQEIKSLGELEKKSEVPTEEPEEKQKGLVSFHRRSFP
ncbi:pleckstrin homology domain-containing family O member 2 isoform X2 [Microcaecilia unicolor]|uniref:Pleckstrin homology domain-containing family O member 2 isoform X2 n=1 Tax=Microcaecilia unicolor TaxID=1415580 RepID=A0A6P7X645_9AMPH|nr:pleckstrin homology domain-containing family O member 2 isoform X2 [Microcaecilia unicolor]